MDDAFLTELDRLFQDDVRPHCCACPSLCIAPLLLAEQLPCMLLMSHETASCTSCNPLHSPQPRDVAGGCAAILG